MKQQFSKSRFQFLAGIINENELKKLQGEGDENNEEIMSIEDYEEEDERKEVPYDLTKLVTLNRGTVAKLNTPLYDQVLGTFDNSSSFKKALISSRIDIGMNNDSNPYTYESYGRPLKVTNGEIYDFGGYDGIFDSDYFPENVRDKVNIVDELDIEDVEDEVLSYGYKSYIQSDLSRSVKLPPLDGINSTWAMGQITGNYGVLCKNMDRSLKPGGIINILGAFGGVEEFLKLFPSYKILYVSLGAFDSNGGCNVVLKK